MRKYGIFLNDHSKLNNCEHASTGASLKTFLTQDQKSSGDVIQDVGLENKAERQKIWEGNQ